jgi:CDP-glucose 4,6-dehydratase
MADPGLNTDSRLVAFYRDRTVLITGSTGFLGYWTVALLRFCGARPIGLSRRDIDCGYRIFAADVRDAQAVTAAVKASKATVVLHLAAQARTRAGQARSTFETNILGTLNVVEAASLVGIPATVVASSSRDPDMPTTDAARRDPYNASKLAAEHIVADYHAEALLADPPRGVALARPAVLVGGADVSSGRLIPDMVARLRAGQEAQPDMPILFRPWQHPLDAAAGMLWLAARLTEQPQGLAPTYNFGLAAHCPRMSAGTLANRLAALWCASAHADADVPAREGFWLDDRRARVDLGWSACWSLDTALGATVEWYRANATGPRAALTEAAGQVLRYCRDAAEAQIAWAAPASA